MDLLFDLLSWICLVVGSFFAVVGGIGIVRLPDFYSRLHGGGITDTLGAGLILVGLMLQSLKVGLSDVLSGSLEAWPWLVTIKLMMILFFLLISSPTSCHALASAGLTNELQPKLSDNEDALAE